MSTLRLIFVDPSLRLVALLLMGFGIVNASLFPYQSLIAVGRVGLSDGAYALVLLLASGVAVTASLGSGIVTDQRANRRAVALVTSASLVMGPLAMLLAPGPVALVICHGLMLPVSASLYVQGFALARLACADRPEARDGVVSVLRAMLSLTFLLALLLWSLAFSRGIDVMAIYTVATAFGLGILLLVLWLWPRDGMTRWTDPPSGLGLGASLAEILHGPVMRPLACLGAITAAPALYMVLISLVFEDQAGRDASDVALFVGLVGGFEVPFMLLLPFALRHARRLTLIAAGAVVYAAFLMLIPALAPTPFVWLLPALAGLGGAAILSLPIAYLQDRMANRPGTGSSLIALQKVVSDTLCALAFAVGMSLGGLGMAALIGGLIAVLGAMLLFADDQALQQRDVAPVT